jgi:hypothetical protein
LAHATAFAGVGCLDRLGFPPHASDTGSRHATVRLILLCALIEGGQLLFSSRHATLLDFILNAASVVTGWTVAGRVFVPNAAASSRWRLGSSRVRLVALVTWALLWTGLIVWPGRLVTLHTWQTGFPLLVGNQLDEDRPWTGEIAYLGIYDRVLEADVVRELSQRLPMRDASRFRSDLGLITQYRFDEAGRHEIHAEGPVGGAELDLRVPPEAQWTSDVSPGLVFDGSYQLSSIGPADVLTDRLSAAGAFAVELWCRPRTVLQDGYARIAGISGGTFFRNFTIGHEGRQLVFRVRNRLNGPNGIGFELRSAAVLSRDYVHLIATYAHGSSSVFVDGERVGRVDLHQPSMSLGLGPRPAGAAVAALLAALSLLIALPPTRDRPGTEILRRVAIGYAILAAPLAFMLTTAFRPAMGFYAWLGPAIPAAYLLVRRSSS